MPYRPTHKQLEYLVAVSETGQFSGAARRCNVSQPTLSTQIHLLEERLQEKLFERSRYGVRPTPLGETVIGLSKDVLSTLDKVLDAAMNTTNNLGGVIKLGVTPTFGPYFLPHVLPTLNSRFPGLKLIIDEAPPADLQKAILAGDYDCILTSPPDGDDRFVYKELVVEQLLLGVSRDHPLSECALIPPELLKGETIFSLSKAHTHIHNKVKAFCASTSALMQQDYTSTNLDAKRRMVSQNMGLAFFPDYYVASEFPKVDDIVLRNISGVQLTRPIGLSWRKNSVRNLQFMQLLEVLKEFRISPDNVHRECKQCLQ